MKQIMKYALVIMSVLALLFVAACGNAKEAGSKQNNNPPENNETNESKEEHKEDGPLTKIEPAITVRSFLASTGKDYLEGNDTLEDNIWTRTLEEELGIKLTYDWIVESANLQDKINMTLVGGDLPDIFFVTQNQFKQLIEADAVEDLTEVYDKYASEMLKSFYTDGADGLKSTRIDGKLYGLTGYSGSQDGIPMAWIRTDWLKKVNMDPPKTMDELIEIARAFKEQDPDNNGKNDTYGIALNKDLDDGWTIALAGFINAYGAYPGVWHKDESGQLIYGSIQPEVKIALAKLQELYKEGIVDPEFGTKDVNQAAESLMAGKGGIFFGPMASPFAISGMVKDGSDADWMAYPIPSATGEPALTNQKIQTGNIFVVKKGFKHPEALVKILNIIAEKLYGEASEAEASKYMGESGQLFHLMPVKLLKPNKNQDLYQEVIKALETSDPSHLSAEGTDNYNGILKYRDGDKSAWWYERIFGPESSQSVIEHYILNDLLITDEFVYPSTNTMGTKKATLDKMMLETFTKIIYGASSIEEFDTFVENWKKLGGNEITAEVNEIAGN